MVASKQLAQALSRAEANYQELRQLLGAPRGRGACGAEARGGHDARRGAAGEHSRRGSCSAFDLDSVPRHRPDTDSGAGTDSGTDRLQHRHRHRHRHRRRPGRDWDCPPPRKAPESSTSLRWPLDAAGFVTRGEVKPGDPAESHSGIDIAVPLGTPVRAAGGAVVEKAGTDSAFGLFVLLQHPGHYETLYGHASRLLVREGDSVQAGQVIALSGSSGHSTAPHLHFEIRLDGKPVDPLTMVKREN